MDFFLLTLVKAAIIAFIFLTTLAYLQLLERKLLAHIQRRPGPYRVGPHGFLQPLADVIKLMTKEDIIPPYVNKTYYILAPFLAVFLALIPVCLLPFGPQVEIFGISTLMQLTDLPVGLVAILAISSIGVYGIALGGWASNSKYSLLGSLRSAAQMVSYELALTIAIATPLLLANSLSLQEITQAQSGFYFGFLPRWHIFQMPWPQIFTFVVFVIAAFAETNRLPFDMPEAENELVGGFHTEYSSMKFAGFFMAEYANIVTICSLGTVLFLGGYNPVFPAEFGSNYVPTILFLGGAGILFFHALQAERWRDKITFPIFGVVFLGVAAVFAVPALRPYLLPVFWFAFKAGLLIFLFIWVRGTLPRFRYDQLMAFAWKFLFPVALVNLIITSGLVAVVS
jgi:NADH-quinone oxidoreductase subunit H